MNAWWSSTTYLWVVLSRKVLLSFSPLVPKPYAAIAVASINLVYLLVRIQYHPKEWNSVLLSSMYIAKDDYKDEMEEEDKHKFKNNYGIHFLLDMGMILGEIALAVGSIMWQFSVPGAAVFEWLGYALFVCGFIFCLYVVPFQVPKWVAKKHRFREEWAAAAPVTQAPRKPRSDTRHGRR